MIAMSEISLPDDPRDWPTDPRVLFGLGADAGPRDLRRAYTVLIRRFKPEHHPQQFRKIRDAFETLEWQLRWRDRAQADFTSDDRDTAAEPEPLPNPMRSPDESAESSATPRSDMAPQAAVPISPANVPIDEDPDRVWARAIRHGGDWPTIYQKLVRAADRGATDELLFCRLYWLLTVARNLDSERQPVDWLAAGLARSVPTPRLMSLYFEELKRRPAEVFHARSRALLNQPRPIWQLADLARQRWLALRTFDRSQEISGDLSVLKDAFFDNRNEWIALLMNAVEVLIWIEGSDIHELRSKYQQEIQDAGDVHLSISDAFDRHELLLALGQEYWKSRHHRGYMSPELPKGLLEMLPDFWFNTDAGRVRLQKILAAWNDHPQIALDAVDTIYETSALAIRYISNILASLASRRFEKPEGHHLWAIVSLIESYEWGVYRFGRPHLLRLCLTNGIWIDEILHVMRETPRFANLAEGDAANQLHADLPLKCVLAGVRAFWR
jgi:hypothetical protein